MSGVAKLRAPAATRDAFTALRLPAWLRRSPIPQVLPWAELALAVVLVFGNSWLLVAAAVGAVALFAAYSVIIGRALGFAEPVQCACFGTLGAHDVSARTMVRNLLLVVLAGLGLAGALVGVSIYSVGSWGWGWVAVAALGAAAVALSLGGSRSVAVADRPAWLANAMVEEPDTHTPVLLRAAGGSGAKVLLFVRQGCGACETVLERVGDLQSAQRPVVVLSGGAWAGPRPNTLPWFTDPGANLARALSGGSTPAAIELGPDGTPISDTAVGSTEVLALLGAVPDAPVPAAAAQLTEEPDEADYLRQPIPPGVLLDFEGSPVALTELAAAKAQLLVGIDCLCSPAMDAIGRLADWGSRLPVLGTRLVVPFHVAESTLTLDQHRVALYDHHGLASRALGLQGQVSAVLLGADGLLAGGPVSGLDEVERFVADIEAELAEAPPAV